MIPKNYLMALDFHFGEDGCFRLVGEDVRLLHSPPPPPRSRTVGGVGGGLPAAAAAAPAAPERGTAEGAVAGMIRRRSASPASASAIRAARVPALAPPPGRRTRSATRRSRAPRLGRFDDMLLLRLTSQSQASHLFVQSSASISSILSTPLPAVPTPPTTAVAQGLALTQLKISCARPWTPTSTSNNPLALCSIAKVWYNNPEGVPVSLLYTTDPRFHRSRWLGQATGGHWQETCF